MSGSKIIFNGNKYNIGTVFKIKSEYEIKFKFNKYLVFKGCNHEKKSYIMGLENEIFASFYIPFDKSNEYIECVYKTNTTDNIKNVDYSKVPTECIDGIMSAWIWYILIMIFLMLINGILNKIVGMSIASLIFFVWRNNKINGG